MASGWWWTGDNDDDNDDNDGGGQSQPDVQARRVLLQRAALLCGEDLAL